MSIDGDLVSLCREFIRKNEITCPETIYQTYWVLENSLEFIQQICDTVGYYEREDNEEE